MKDLYIIMTQEEMIIELMQNISTPNLNKVKELIADGVDINFDYNGCPPLTCAFFYSADITKYLIEQGADPSFMPKDERNKYNQPFYYLYVTLSDGWTNNPKLNESVNELKQYLNQYEIQKLILTNHPNSIFDMKQYNFILPEIENEFGYLLTSRDLNLL